jgi:hypothetical protein
MLKVNFSNLNAALRIIYTSDYTVRFEILKLNLQIATLARFHSKRQVAIWVQICTAKSDV